MSFEINGPDNNLSSIQKSHHANDGGAGNLGYFQQGKKKKDKENKKEELDVFESSSNKASDDEFSEFDEDNDIDKKLNSIGVKIKYFWFRLNEFFKDNSEEK